MSGGIMPTDPDALQQRLQVVLQTIKDNDAARQMIQYSTVDMTVQ